jgi:hypothetical protein
MSAVEQALYDSRRGDMESTRKQARFAGLLYLLLGITAPLGLMLVPAQLIVSKNAMATADHIRASEGLLRAGIGSELFHQIVVVFLVLALYRLFKAVNESHARQLVILGALVSVPIVFVNVLNEIAALILVRDPAFLAVFEKPQLDALAYLFIRLHSQGIVVASIFWGLWLFPFGLLVIRSGFIPRWIGVSLLIGGLGYLASSFIFLLLPSSAHPIGQFAGILEAGELPIMVWLLFWGARDQSPKEQPAATVAPA